MTTKSTLNSLLSTKVVLQGVTLSSISISGLFVTATLQREINHLGKLAIFLFGLVQFINNAKGINPIKRH